MNGISGISEGKQTGKFASGLHLWFECLNSSHYTT